MNAFPVSCEQWASINFIWRFSSELQLVYLYSEIIYSVFYMQRNTRKKGKPSQTWWHEFVMPAFQKAEARESMSTVQLLENVLLIILMCLHKDTRTSLEFIYFAWGHQDPGHVKLESIPNSRNISSLGGTWMIASDFSTFQNYLSTLRATPVRALWVVEWRAAEPQSMDRLLEQEENLEILFCGGPRWENTLPQRPPLSHHLNVHICKQLYPKVQGPKDLGM